LNIGWDLAKLWQKNKVVPFFTGHGVEGNQASFYAATQKKPSHLRFCNTAAAVMTDARIPRNCAEIW